MTLERLWIIVSAVLLIVAAVFMWRNNVSFAFVTAALGAVAWFLSFRAQIRARMAKTEMEANESELFDESDEK